MIGGREDRIMRADRIGKVVWRGDGKNSMVTLVWRWVRKFTIIALVLWFGLEA